MADCIECGRVVEELGYKCNHCGREVCWDHRRPGDHDCRPDGDPTAARAVASETATGAIEGERSGPLRERDGATVTAREDRPAAPAGDATADPSASYDLEADERAYPWWVYVLVVLLFVFPSLVTGILAVL